MDAISILNKTKLGKELMKILPPKTRRVMIDISADSIPVIYIETTDERLFDLDWSEALSKFEKKGNIMSLKITGIISSIQFCNTGRFEEYRGVERFSVMPIDNEPEDLEKLRMMLGECCTFTIELCENPLLENQDCNP